jgi:uncharacterized Fe-S cluster protein YjdI
MPIKKLKYKNKDITIVWKPELCIHSTLCWKGLREVFDPARRPWIMPDAATSLLIIDQIHKCPSGALSYINNAEEPSNAEQFVPAPQNSIIECTPNGPLLITGEVMLKKPDGIEEKKNGTIALCRCGASKNKPYCDGSHRTTGFVG